LSVWDSHLKEPLKTRAARFGLLAGGYLLVTLVLTWPLAANLGRAIPAGSEPATVSLHQLFLMEHNAGYLDGQRSYWDAGFFHPHQGTFAWSEPQQLSGLMFWGLRQLGAGPACAYDLLVLLYLLAAGLIAYGLSRQLVDDRLVAFICGSWVCAGAYVLHQLCVLHLLALVMPAWFLWSLIELRRGFRIAPLAGLGCAYVLTWLTCAQFGMFLTLLFPVAFFALFRPSELDWKKWLKLAATGLVALLAILPMLLAQHSRLQSMGLERPLTDIRGNFHLPDLFLPAKGHWLTGRLLGFDQRTDIYSWDPGLILLAVLLAALALGYWRVVKQDSARFRIFRTHVWLFVAALLLGFGPRLGVWIDGENYGPYALLTAIIPGLDGVRSPARLAAFMTLSLSVLAAGGLAHLRGRGYTEAVGWLGKTADRGAVLELPLATGNRPADLEGEVRAMRRMLVHGHPIVNGYSAHFPEPFWQLAQALRDDPGGRGLRFIRALGVRYLLADTNKTDAGPVLEQASQSVQVFADGVVVFELKPGESDEALEFPESTKLRRAPEEGNMLRIRLGRPGDRARLFMAGEERTLRVRWEGEAGDWESVDLRLHGSVLVDQGETVAYLLITDLPIWGSSGRARLISRIEVNRRSPGTQFPTPSKPSAGEYPETR
jgi:hypothetical protein